MATYTLKGKRYLRKYTAPTLTPVYGTAGDVATMAANLCNCPWEAVEPADACLPSHAEASLDKNVDSRDYFDAAAFCAAHADGLHRIYGQAACYVFTLPDSAIGISLNSLSAQIISDPYCAAGVRVAVHTASTLAIPEDCATSRTGNGYVQGVAPRTSTQNSNGSYTWTGATAAAEIVFDTPIALDKYLMVVVAQEQFVGRAGYAEGASYMRNAVTIETAAAIPADGWTDNSTIDCSASVRAAFPILHPTSVPRRTTLSTNVFTSIRLGNGDAPPFEDSLQSKDVSESAAGLNALYSDLLLARLSPVPVGILPSTTKRMGVGFTLVYGPLVYQSTLNEEIMETNAWQLTLSALTIPMVLPWEQGTLNMSWEPPAVANGVLRAWLKFSAVEPTEEELRNPGLYTAAVSEIEGIRLLGSSAANTGAVSFSLPKVSTPLPATLIVVAYLPPENARLVTDVQGVASLMCNLPLADAHGFDTLIYPTITIS